MFTKLLFCFWVGPKFVTHGIKVATDNIVIKTNKQTKKAEQNLNRK